MNLSNLTPLQANTLKLLKANDNLIIKPTDKNLGPAIMYTISYIQQVLNEHLITTTYKQLTPAEMQNGFIGSTFSAVYQRYTKLQSLVSCTHSLLAIFF